MTLSIFWACRRSNIVPWENAVFKYSCFGNPSQDIVQYHVVIESLF